MYQDARQTTERGDPQQSQESVVKTEARRSADADEKTSESLLGHVLDRGRGAIRRHPFAAVGGAFAFGFVVGNGIPRFVAQTAVTMGLRVLLQRVLEEATVGVGS